MSRNAERWPIRASDVEQAPSQLGSLQIFRAHGGGRARRRTVLLRVLLFHVLFEFFVEVLRNFSAN